MRCKDCKLSLNWLVMKRICRIVNPLSCQATLKKRISKLETLHTPSFKDKEGAEPCWLDRQENLCAPKASGLCRQRSHTASKVILRSLRTQGGLFNRPQSSVHFRYWIACADDERPYLFLIEQYVNVEFLCQDRHQNKIWVTKGEPCPYRRCGYLRLYTFNFWLHKQLFAVHASVKRVFLAAKSFRATSAQFLVEKAGKEPFLNLFWLDAQLCWRASSTIEWWFETGFSIP